jgi:lipid-binding SYLF domain-containing protein
MKRVWTLLAVGLALAPASEASRASDREAATVELAIEVLEAQAAAAPLLCIPHALLREAQGVAIIPNVFKAGFIVGGRFGRGVVLVRQPDGNWGNPVFVCLAGGGIGWQVGLQSTDLVLVFKTSNGLDRILKGRGKVTLGADIGVAAGPVGRQAEAATDVQLKAEIYSYSRSRGLFAGLSLEGAGMWMDFEANEAFYRLQGGRPADVMALRAVPLPAANLKIMLTRLSAPPPPMGILLPPVPPPPAMPNPPVPIPPPPAAPSPPP